MKASMRMLSAGLSLGLVACTSPQTLSQPEEQAVARTAPARALEPEPAAIPAQPRAVNAEQAAEAKPPPVEPALAPDGKTRALPCLQAPPAMSCIAGGFFVRGSDEGPNNARPEAKIWLQTYFMDQFEVTYAQYKACQSAKQCPRSGPRYSDFNHPKMPIQGVSWHDAVAYCSAQGKGLPTEAQWEKAARGPDGELYPWGDEPVTCERAILRDASGRSCGLKKAISKPEVGRPWDVGSRPVGRYGLYDMVGNSWEWVADWYSRGYEKCGEDCLGMDPRGPCGGAEKCAGHGMKIVRGGSWYWEDAKATGVYRRSHFPSNEPFHHFGFRCAATTPQVEALAAQ